jgi:Zn-dependent protease
LHWSILLGAYFFSGFRIVPAYWAGFVFLILLHELGHALLVQRYRLGVSEIVIHGAGGYCRHDRTASPWQDSVIAWGGVLAQAVAYVVAVAIARLVAPITSPVGYQLLHLFTSSNLWLIFINLLPIPPLDGRQAWALIPQIIRRFRSGPPRGGGGREDLEAAQRSHREAQQLVRDLLDRTNRPR